MEALAGIRVLDLTTVGPGARCAAMLADYGADVVRIGPPSSARRIVPQPWAYSAGRGVRRLGIDLKEPTGRDALLALAATSDVLVEGFRPGVADRLGIGFEDVRRARPNVVYASLTGYGQDGPYADWAGHDLNYQAVSGALSTAGRRADGGPALPGTTFADSGGGGMHAALAICAALVGRTEASPAVHLDVAATDGMLSFMSLALDEHLATGRRIEAGSSLLTGRYACYDVYPCADGNWVSVAAIEPKFWANLCRLLGCEQWSDRQLDDEVQDQIRADIREAFGRRSRDEWVDILAPNDTCVAPVLSVAEVADNEHLAARAAFGQVAVGDEHQRQTARVLAGTVPRAEEVGLSPDDSHALELLSDVGMAADDIAKLIDAGVIQ